MFYDKNGDLTPSGEVFATGCEVISGEFWVDYIEDSLKDLPNWAQIVSLLFFGLIVIGIAAFATWECFFI